MGLAEARGFGNYHRVLSRAVWSSRQAARTLLMHLIGTFVAGGTIVLGMDDTIERRKGNRIKATGLYRDAVRKECQSSGQSQWLAVVKPDAVGGDSVGTTGLGITVSDGIGPLRALSSNPRTTA
jgi:DDE superfamily endonuclease